MIKTGEAARAGRITSFMPYVLGISLSAALLFIPFVAMAFAATA